jgi:hypothetical protein
MAAKPVTRQQGIGSLVTLARTISRWEDEPRRGLARRGNLATAGEQCEPAKRIG